MISIPLYSFNLFFPLTFQPRACLCNWGVLLSSPPFQYHPRDCKHGHITGPTSAILSVPLLTVHLPQFHRLLSRVNIYKCALNNICCGSSRAAWLSKRDGAHQELMGAYVLLGSFCLLGGFKCHKQLVPDEAHDATQMNEKLREYLWLFME